MDGVKVGKVVRGELGRFLDEALDPYLRRTFSTKDDLKQLGTDLREDLASKDDLKRMEKDLREDLASKVDVDTAKKQLSGEMTELRGDLGLTKMRVGKKLGISFSAS